MATQPLTGMRVGPYTLGQPLGEGGSAAVFRTTDPHGRTVAIKVRAIGDANLDRRFLREFESIRRLHLPGIIQVHDAGIANRWLWYTMEIVEGDNVRAWIQAGDGPAERALRACEAGARLADTVHRIHLAGFIHRDLKPSNVMVDERGWPRVLDFGVVHFWGATETLTGSGGLVGTPSFMAPEQVTGMPLTPAADVFSLGLILYEGLNGRRPRPPSATGWLSMQVLERMTPLVCIEPRLPRSLSTVIDRCLALDPAERPSAGELARLLRGCLDDTTGLDWPEPDGFVGREPELKAVEQALQGMGPRFLVVSGPAGSGRRRLLEQARRRTMLRGIRTLTGHCRIDQPGSAIGEILGKLLAAPAREDWRRRVAGVDAHTLLELWPQLPVQAMSDDPGGVSANRSDVVRSAAEAILRAAQDHPLALVLHELEEIDPISARVVDALAQAPGAPVPVVGIRDRRRPSARADRLLASQVGEGRGRALDLGPMDSASCGAIARSLAPDAGRLQAPAGLPLRAVQVGLRALAQLREEPFHDLPPKAAWLAILDQPLPQSVASRWLGPVGALLDGGFLVRGADDKLRSAGPSFQRAADADLEDAQSAHEALAAAWEASSGFGEGRWIEVARHRVRSRGGENAWEAALKAAIAAERAGRNDVARSWLLLLDGMEKDRRSAAYQDLRFTLSWARARVANATGTERPRRDLLDAAAQRAQSASDRARLALLEVDYSLRTGNPEEAAQAAAAAAGRFHRDDPEASVLLRLAEADAWLELGRPDHALAAAESAQAALVRSFDVYLPAEIEARRCSALVGAGHFGNAAREARRALQGAERVDHPGAEAEASEALARALLRLGERAEAEARALRALELARTHHQPARMASAGALLAEMALEGGEPRRAEVLLAEARSTARKVGRHGLFSDLDALAVELAAVEEESLPVPPANARGRLAWIRAARLRGDRAQVESLLQQLPTGGWIAAMGHLEAARCHLDFGDRGRARAEIEAGRAIALREGLAEQIAWAEILEGAASPRHAHGWDEAVERCLTARWVELFLGVLDLDGQRRFALGDTEGAIARWRSLASRAVEIGHKPYQKRAQRLLARSLPPPE